MFGSEWFVEEDKVPESSKAALKVNSFVAKDGFILLCCLSPPVTFAGPCWPMLLNPLCILCHPLRTRSPQEFQSSTAKEAPAKELSHQSAASTGTTKDCLRLLAKVHANQYKRDALSAHNHLVLGSPGSEKLRKKRMIMCLCPRTIRRGADLRRTFWDTWCWTVDYCWLQQWWPIFGQHLAFLVIGWSVSWTGCHFEEAEKKLRW